MLTEEDLQNRRLKHCVEQWPGCESGLYDPNCCRFPKVCSPYGRIEAAQVGNLTEDDLESPKSVRKPPVKTDEPLLGLATTRQLLEEIKARGEMAAYTEGGGHVEERNMALVAGVYLNNLPPEVLAYRTVDGEFRACGPTEDALCCACGCSAYDERCKLYLIRYESTTQVPESHICCKIPGRE